MNLTTWQQTGSYFNYLDTYRIFYQEVAGSDKEILLLLHGFPTASWDWNKIWKQLSDKFHVIAPDFIGYGLSDKPKRYQYSTQKQADIVEALLRSKDMAKVHVLAHDFGDTVMQELLARNLERLKGKVPGVDYSSVCLLNGGLFPETHIPRPIQKLLISPIGPLITPFLSKKKLKKNFTDIFGKNTPPSDQEIDEFYYLMTYNRGKYVFHKLIRYMAERREHRDRWVGALQQCEVPLRLINGNADPVSGKHMTERYIELIPNADVVHLPGIGHYPQTEAPDMVLKHFSEFHRDNLKKIG